ncbi:MAG: protein kinase [Planctomycetes bacterium]|nr:protein kinase [Planctomycetota bacterium]
MDDPPRQTDSQHSDALSFLSFEQDAVGLPSVGADIGEYILLSVLGRGATGVVYEAQQKSLGRRVALKLIPLVASDRTAEGKARLEREGRLLASLQHPNIIEVFDTGLTPDYRWLAMSLIKGYNLGEILAGRADALPSPTSADWLAFILPVLRQLSSALASAHAQGIVHRDIKPSNILLDEDGTPHLVDFGLADRDHMIRQAGATGFIGTPLYASPEQARGLALTSASDVFSLGTVAFEALNGSPPFKGENQRELLRNIQFADPVWKNPRNIPTDVRAVIEKCLEKRIPDGYSSAKEVEEEFARFLRFEPVQAIPRGRLSRWWQRTSRNPRRAAITGSIAVLAIAALGTGLIAKVQGSQLEEIRVQVEYKETAELWHRGLVEAFRERLKDLPRGDRLRLQGDAFLLEAEHELAMANYQSVTLKPDSLADQVSVILASNPRDLAVLPELAPQLEAKTPRDWLLLCMYFNQSGQYEETIKAVRTASVFYPTSYPLRFVEGFAARGLGQTDQAIKSLQGSLDLYAQSVQSLRQLARVLKSADRFNDCEVALRQCLKLEPESALVWADLANLMMVSKRFDEAELPLQKAAEIDQGLLHPWVTSVRAQDLLRRKKYQEAEKLLLQGLEVRPSAWHLLNRLGWLRLKQKEWQQAMLISEELINQPFAGWQSRGYFMRGQALFGLERYDECIPAFIECSKLRPDMDTWTWFSARSVLQAGKYDVLASFLDVVLETDPKQFQALLFSVQLRLLRKADGDLEQAYDLAIRAVGLQPQSAEAHHWLAFTLTEQGHPDLALKHLKVVLNSQPDHSAGLALEKRCLDLLAQ